MIPVSVLVAILSAVVISLAMCALAAQLTLRMVPRKVR
jgi:multisubunit Na+/H+ antiporter MnhC subunit